MNKQEIQEELNKINEQRKTAEFGTPLANELWDKNFLLNSQLECYENLPECSEEIETIYEAKRKIKELEKLIKETQNKAVQKMGFKKDIKFEDKEGNKYIVTVERMYRKLKKDGTISNKESVKYLGVENLHQFKIV